MKNNINRLIFGEEITPPEIFYNRRRFMQMSFAGSVAALFASKALGAEKLPASSSSAFGLTDQLTSQEAATHYNNFYEFGTDKDSPSRLAENFKTRPWSLSVEGEVGRPLTFNLAELMKLAPIEERIYRLRCVETWSMVIPWLGFPLSELLKRAEPTDKAKFVEFTSLYDPAQMPGQKTAVLEWPYREGLRMDEAMHPLTLLCFGLYGDMLTNQNGAPVRVVTPWKYGFKSAKSIVRIRLLEQPPLTSWMRAGPSEYGFYANVNPEVDHQRWSQAKERRIGEFFKRPTLPFNGYAEQVSQLYTGMDLSKNF